MSSESGWEFVFLPLDPVAEIQGNKGQDLSSWPDATLMVLHYDHGFAAPMDASWGAFLLWTAELQSSSEDGEWRVTGHTDASGTDEVNAALSLARAEYVATHLETHMKWPRNRIQVRAAGSHEPFSSDPAQNRRVEVRWVPAMQ